MNNNDAKAFTLLSSGMQKWVSNQHWSGFRDIQSEAIIKIMGRTESSVIRSTVVSAGTGMGKTEAAFLPALSAIQMFREQNPSERFCSMLYVAPLKALINDQFRRLSEMAEYIGESVYLWHGDASQSRKKEMLRRHDGVIMITPESLESFLMNRGAWCSEYMHPIVIVIDEFHSFLNGTRGKQMLSLLSRIDAMSMMNGYPPAARIGLSATLSNLELVGKILTNGRKCEIVDGTKGSHSNDVNVQIKTYESPRGKVEKSSELSSEKKKLDARSSVDDDVAICEEIIRESSGEKTLTFARSRMQVENTTSLINTICKEKGIKAEALAHHGSLSKEARESVEHRLVSTSKPTMAIATITLELGIDIGDIFKVFQIGTTDTVSSLRQRAGRSGRRSGASKLECIETVGKLGDELESDLVETIAEIELMRAGWFEPPMAKRKDVSVLVSEIMSVIVQYETAYEKELYSLLCEHGAFSNVRSELFNMIIGDMIESDLLVSGNDGLMIGSAGEKEVTDWKFYASFQSDDAYTVRCGMKTIGEITPPDTAMMSLMKGGSFMLGGRCWQVVPPITGKTINVKPTRAKSKFLVPISKGRSAVNGTIQRTMLDILIGRFKAYEPDYLDDTGRKHLACARESAEQYQLNKLGVSIARIEHLTDTEMNEELAKGYNEETIIHVAPPVSEATLNGIAKMLEACGMEQNGLEAIPMWRLDELIDAVLEHIDDVKSSRSKENLIDSGMLNDIRESEKYNKYLSDETLRYAYVDEKMNLDEAEEWFKAFKRFATESM